MGKVFENLTEEELCDLMCGGPEPELNEYHISFMAIYTDVVEATSPEEAVNIAAQNCPYDIDWPAHVIRIDTDEEWDI